MCSISGIFSPSDLVKKIDLMIDTQKHRAPDSEVFSLIRIFQLEWAGKDN